MKQGDKSSWHHGKQSASAVHAEERERYDAASLTADEVVISRAGTSATYAETTFRKTLFSKQRLGYGLAVLVTIVLGLASRRYANVLPPFVADHAGDILWAMMVYWGCRMLLYRGYGIAILAALLFCYGIEFSQLYQAEWIRQLRDTTIGGLVLGHGFLIVDLIRYTVGVGLAAGLDWLARYMLRQ